MTVKDILKFWGRHLVLVPATLFAFFIGLQHQDLLSLIVACVLAAAGAYDARKFAAEMAKQDSSISGGK